MLGTFVKNNIKTKLLRSLIVIISFAVSVTLVLTVFNLSVQVEDTFIKNSGQYDVVVGPKGSDMNLVLSSVFYYYDAADTIPYSEYEALQANPLVASAVPLAMADNVEGHKIVGTTASFFENYNFSEGAAFTEEFQMVLGATAASQIGLKVGDTVVGTHGADNVDNDEVEEGHDHSASPYTVVGILEKTGTPVDLVCIAEICSIWHLHAHEEGEEHEEHEHEEGNLTAVMVKATDAFAASSLVLLYDDNASVMACNINAVMRELLSLFDSVIGIITVVVAVVIVMALIMMFLSMFTAVSEMKRDLAVLRAIGAKRTDIFGIVVLEALILSLIGMVAGYLLSRMVILFIGLFVSGTIGTAFSVFTLYSTEIAILVLTPVLGMLSAVIPAIMVYRLEPTKYLR